MFYSADLQPLRQVCQLPHDIIEQFQEAHSAKSVFFCAITIFNHSVS